MLLPVLLFGAVLQQPPTAELPSPPPAPVPVAAEAVPLDGEQLDASRGGQGEVFILTEQTLGAVNGSQMQAGTIGSGQIFLDGGAFSNFDGVGNFVLNTGHQNNIQSAINLSIVLGAPLSQP
ncbi:hypothetical protein [Caulobacter mirabilis]|uniref:Uncharacterized protein n=1 Tax=Caulobacter mirabilis TaxID=69666 RepID=A0A2D2AY74_9CAUL|nr:hypothetical protein [Caulobacter mirabilis]ATQ42970.1 hypothetical protein CSW64_11395 [Caulobacter mirabilis]